MRKNLVLSIKQMRELKKLHIDTSSNASMSYLYFDGDEDSAMLYSTTPIELVKDVIDKSQNIDTTIVPAFTLYDILNILPQKVTIVSQCDERFVEYEFCMKKNIIGYHYADKLDPHWAMSFSITDGNVLESAYNLLLWYKKEKGNNIL